MQVKTRLRGESRWLESSSLKTLIFSDVLQSEYSLGCAYGTVTQDQIRDDTAESKRENVHT